MLKHQEKLIAAQRFSGFLDLQVLYVTAEEEHPRYTDGLFLHARSVIQNVLSRAFDPGVRIHSSCITLALKSLGDAFFSCPVCDPFRKHDHNDSAGGW